MHNYPTRIIHDNGPITEKIESGDISQKDLMQEKNRLGKFIILSNMRSDPRGIYNLYKSREEVGTAFDAMKNELGNDKAYVHTTEGFRGIFLHILHIAVHLSQHPSQVLKGHDVSQKISVKEALFELSKIYVIADGERRTLAEIPERSKKIADIFGLKLYPM